MQNLCWCCVKTLLGTKPLNLRAALTLAWHILGSDAEIICEVWQRIQHQKKKLEKSQLLRLVSVIVIDLVLLIGASP
jgi:hypothetical protein